jgi:S1-C subfamily serine protease
MMGEGNSGSPVFDMSGEVVGVIYAGIGESGSISFAVAVEAIHALLENASSTPAPLVRERERFVLGNRSRNLLIASGRRPGISDGPDRGGVQGGPGRNGEPLLGSRVVAGSAHPWAWRALAPRG